MARPTNQDIFNEVIRLCELIEGDRDNRHDDGLQGDVKENTAFRKSSQRMIFVLYSGIIAGNIPILWFGGKLIIKKLTGEF